VLLHRFEEAEAAIARAKEISPDDKSITAAQKGLLDRKKEYRSKSRELQKRMAQSLVSESKTVDSSAAETKRDKQESPHPAPEEKPLAGQAEATGTVVDDSSPTQRDEAGDTVVDRSCPPQPPAVQEPGPSVEFDAPAGATPKVDYNTSTSQFWSTAVWFSMFFTVLAVVIFTTQVPPPSTGGEN
jgi:cobalamin biosynthesis Mg chelatase CobN